jgi:hypothetical protein
MENFKLKGQFGRKVVSNESKHKYLGLSAIALGLSNRRLCLKHRRTKIEHSCA